MNFYIIKSFIFLIFYSFSINYVFAESADEKLLRGMEAWEQGNCKVGTDIIIPFAKKGNPLAQYSMAVMLTQNECIGSDNKLSFEIMQKCVGKVEGYCLCHLGTFYLGGKKKKKDFQKALMWMNLSLDLLPPESDMSFVCKTTIGLAKRNMSEVEIKNSEILGLQCKANKYRGC